MVWLGVLLFDLYGKFWILEMQVDHKEILRYRIILDGGRKEGVRAYSDEVILSAKGK